MDEPRRLEGGPSGMQRGATTTRCDLLKASRGTSPYKLLPSRPVSTGSAAGRANRLVHAIPPRR